MEAAGGDGREWKQAQAARVLVQDTKDAARLAEGSNVAGGRLVFIVGGGDER